MVAMPLKNIRIAARVVRLVRFIEILPVNNRVGSNFSQENTNCAFPSHDAGITTFGKIVPRIWDKHHAGLARVHCQRHCSGSNAAGYAVCCKP
jgi:hypothetical protein